MLAQCLFANIAVLLCLCRDRHLIAQATPDVLKF
jgi:hypothetical protein